MNKEVQLGVIFPTKDIAGEMQDLRAFAPSSEQLGLDFITTYDHVVGANESHHDLTGSETNCLFTDQIPVHEPLILFGAMSVLTDKIRLIPGCLVAPQRQTALIAKQVAEIDILCGGRFELGVSIGWNKIEFEALGADYTQRASTLEAQVSLLRELWTSHDVNITNGDERFEHVSINPLPPQQPIPIWMGGLAPKAIERAARIGDGWLPLGYIDAEMEQRIALYRRSKQNLGGDGRIMGRVNPWRDTHQKAYEDYRKWLQNGATHIAIGSSANVYSSNEQFFNELKIFLDCLA